MFVWPLFGRHTPRTLAAMTIRSERGPVQMGFPRREAEEVAVYPPRDRQAAPSRLSLRARPAGRKPQGRARKHWWDLISLRAQWGHLGTPHVTPPEEEPQSLPRCSTCPASDIDLDLEESTSLSLSNGGG